MNNEDEYKLYIPSNVKTRMEFFKGYGVKELISTIIIFACLLPISLIIYKLKENFLLPVVIEFIGVAGTIISTAKDENNLCVINQIKFLIDFAKIQKQYRYKYFNKWRESIDKNIKKII